MRDLPRGIVPIIQTPFDASGALSSPCFDRLVDDAVESGAAGLVYPAVASEVEALSMDERSALTRRLCDVASGRAEVIVGASSRSVDDSFSIAEEAGESGAAAVLIQPPPEALESPESLIAFLNAFAARTELPIILQDLDWHGPGVPLETILRAADATPQLAGVKIETSPAGPKYSAIRAATEGRLHVSGGWAVTQMIDGLRRGVDAFMPEASLVRVYRAIWDAFQSGDARRAESIFSRLAPILLFSNQEIGVSIQFFKRVLQRRGVFQTAHCRDGVRPLDAVQSSEADRLADTAVALWNQIEESGGDVR